MKIARIYRARRPVGCVRCEEPGRLVLRRGKRRVGLCARHAEILIGLLWLAGKHVYRSWRARRILKKAAVWADT